MTGTDRLLGAGLAGVRLVVPDRRRPGQRRGYGEVLRGSGRYRQALRGWLGRDWLLDAR